MTPVAGTGSWTRTYPLRGFGINERALVSLVRNTRGVRQDQPRPDSNLDQDANPNCNTEEEEVYYLSTSA